MIGLLANDVAKIALNKVEVNCFDSDACSGGRQGWQLKLPKIKKKSSERSNHSTTNTNYRHPN